MPAYWSKYLGPEGIPQFYAVEAEYRKRGETEFKKKLVEMDIKHILARVMHPQTNGKLERFHEELQYQLPGFVESSAEKTSRIQSSQTQYHVGGIFHTAGAEDPVKRMVDWYNYERTHMSLLKGETPAHAFVRKMAPPGQTVLDEQTGEEYDVTSD